MKTNEEWQCQCNLDERKCLCACQCQKSAVMFELCRGEAGEQTGAIGDLFVCDQNPTSDFSVSRPVLSEASNNTSEMRFPQRLIVLDFNLFGQREEIGCFILM